MRPGVACRTSGRYAPGMAHLHVRIPDGILVRIDAEATENNRTRSQQVNFMLRRWLASEAAKPEQRKVVGG